MENWVSVAIRVSTFTALHWFPSNVAASSGLDDSAGLRERAHVDSPTTPGRDRFPIMSWCCTQRHVLAGSVGFRAEVRSASTERLAAVDGQQDAGDELGLIGGQVQRGVGDVPCRAHAVAERHRGVSFGDEALAID